MESLERQPAEDSTRQAMPPPEGAKRHVAFGVYIRKGRLVGVVVDVLEYIVKRSSARG